MNILPILHLALSQMSTKSAGQLLNIHLLKRTIQVRKQQIQLPNNPINFNFTISDRIQKPLTESYFYNITVLQIALEFKFV